jgi:hypothetical protein
MIFASRIQNLDLHFDLVGMFMLGSLKLWHQKKSYAPVKKWYWYGTVIFFTVLSESYQLQQTTSVYQ